MSTILTKLYFSKHSHDPAKHNGDDFAHYCGFLTVNYENVSIFAPLNYPTMTEPNNDLDHQPETGKNSSPVLVILIFLIALLTLLLVIDSARQEGNDQRRPFVPEALDAAYKPYPASVQAPDNGTTTPVDSMVRDIYVAQREINQGAHQLFLFFDTFTHRPAPLNLKDFDLNRPQDAQWYNFAIIQSSPKS